MLDTHEQTRRSWRTEAGKVKVKGVPMRGVESAEPEAERAGVGVDVERRPIHSRSLRVCA